MPPNKGADLSLVRSCRRVATQPPETSPQRTVETTKLASMDRARAGELVALLKAWHPNHYDGRTSPLMQLADGSARRRKGSSMIEASTSLSSF